MRAGLALLALACFPFRLFADDPSPSPDQETQPGDQAIGLELPKVDLSATGAYRSSPQPALTEALGAALLGADTTTSASRAGRFSTKVGLGFTASPTDFL